MATEREKMQKGVLYDANNDEELCAARLKAADICFEYNSLRPSDKEGRERIIRKLFKRTGRSFTVISPFFCDYGSNISVGENFFSNYNLVILDPAEVTFGDNVFIGPSCGFHAAGHPIDSLRRNAGLEYAWPITVGDNVWFGAGVQVLPGVTIGSDVVIGAGSVVVRDIPGGSVAVGNPCRVIRAITDADLERVYQKKGH